MAGEGAHLSDRKALKAIKENPWVLTEHRDRAWRRIEQIMLQSKDIRAARASAEMIVNRTDPLPSKPLIEATLTGPTIVIWDLSAPEIPPASAPTAPRLTSSADSNGSTSSSVIEAGERPPSESTG
jgi:hypothetical protein